MSRLALELETSEDEESSLRLGLQSLEEVVWRPLLVKEKAFYIKARFDDSGYALLVTDLVLVWYRVSDNDAVEKEREQYNSVIDTPLRELLRRLKRYLWKTEPGVEFDYSIDGPEESGPLSLRLSTLIDFYSFTWTFVCARYEGEATFLRDHMIVPLLDLCSELWRELERAKELLSSKETELESARTRSSKRSGSASSSRFDARTFQETQLRDAERYLPQRSEDGLPLARLPRIAKDLLRISLRRRLRASSSSPQPPLSQQGVLEFEDADPPPPPPPRASSVSPASLSQSQPLVPHVLRRPSSGHSHSQNQRPSTRANSAHSQEASLPPVSPPISGMYVETPEELRMQEELRRKLERERERKLRKAERKRKRII